MTSRIEAASYIEVCTEDEEKHRVDVGGHLERRAVRNHRLLENLKACPKQQTTFLCFESVRPARSALAADVCTGRRNLTSMTHFLDLLSLDPFGQ